MKFIKLTLIVFMMVLSTNGFSFNSDRVENSKVEILQKECLNKNDFEMKKKILLNGMEFMSQPVCFLIPKKSGYVEELLNENDFLFGKVLPFNEGEVLGGISCTFALKGKFSTHEPTDNSFNFLFDGFDSFSDYWFEGLRLTLLNEWVPIYDNFGGI